MLGERRGWIMMVSCLALACSPPARSSAQGSAAPGDVHAAAPAATAAPQPAGSAAARAEDLAVLPPGLSCDAMVRAIDDRFAALDPLASRLPMSPDNVDALPASADGVAPPEGHALAILHGELRMAYETRGAGVPREAGALVTDLNRRRARILVVAQPLPALVAAGHDAEDTRDVVTALESLARAGVPTWLVARKKGAQRLPDKRATAPSPDPSADVMEIATTLTAASAACPATAKLNDAALSLAGKAGEARALVTRELPRALASCACKPDGITLFRTWTELLFDGEPIIGKRITVSADPSATLVKADGLDGSAFYAALPADGRPIRFH
jgi:hypothetical protein